MKDPNFENFDNPLETLEYLINKIDNSNVFLMGSTAKGMTPLFFQSFDKSVLLQKTIIIHQGGNKKSYFRSLIKQYVPYGIKDLNYIPKLEFVLIH